jgi:hypothetical protein
MTFITGQDSEKESFPKWRVAEVERQAVEKIPHALSANVSRARCPACERDRYEIGLTGVVNVNLKVLI